MTYSPNLNIEPDWKSTLRSAFGTLRRVAFLTPDDFKLGTFDLQTDYQGMTVTNNVDNRGRFIKIGNFFWFSVDIRATLAAPFANRIKIKIPYTAAEVNDNTIQRQGGGCFATNAGVVEAGCWSILQNLNEISFFRAAGGAFTAGIAEFTANGFLEVK